MPKTKPGKTAAKLAAKAPAKTSPKKAPSGTPVPIDPAKLIAEAKRALPKRKGRPQSVKLRRAVSTAYYALFHSICRQTADHLLPSGSTDDRLRVARSFGHRDIKMVCEWIAGRAKTNDTLEPLVKRLMNTVISDVAMAFIDLQESRHDADYNHLEPFSQQATSAVVSDAEAAINVLAVTPSDDRELFFALVAIRARSSA